MTTEKPKSLGQAIDAIINALNGISSNDQLVAIRAACEHLSLSNLITQPTGQQDEYASTHANPLQQTHLGTPHQTTPLDIRSLKEEKKPSSAREMACIVAYYLQNLAPEVERKDTISSDDITKYFKQAGYPLPTALSQLLKDAKGAGYFDSADRGTYKLNPVGYNLVAHSLPRDKQATTPKRNNKKPKPKKISTRRKTNKR